MTEPHDHDVVIIGSGVGGLVAAARLVLAGQRPLVLEAGERIGGRFSTLEKDGYKVPTCAIAIETGGPFYETFERLGIDADLRIPDPAVRVRIKGRDVTAGAPAWEFMIKKVTKSAARVADAVRSSTDETGQDMNLEEWARRYTRSKTVLTLFDTLARSLFTVNADELSARTFFRNLRTTGGYKTFGFAPRGNIVIAEAIAAAIGDRGGEVRTGWRGIGIEIEAGRAVAVTATGPDGSEHRILARAVISDVGPRGTAKLVEGTDVEEEFAERVKDVQPTSMLKIAFSTDEDILPGCPGMMNFTDTRRLCSLGNMTALCPELAPPGRTLYDAYGVPRPSIGGDFDAEAERRLFEQDLLEKLPGFERAETIDFTVLRGDRPAMHSSSGRDPDRATPVPNLFDVGDGVKPDGWIGTSACARTAELAVAALLEEPVFAGSGVASAA